MKNLWVIGIILALCSPAWAQPSDGAIVLESSTTPCTWDEGCVASTSSTTVTIPPHTANDVTIYLTEMGRSPQDAAQYALAEVIQGRWVAVQFSSNIGPPLGSPPWSICMTRTGVDSTRFLPSEFQLRTWDNTVTQKIDPNGEWVNVPGRITVTTSTDTTVPYDVTVCGSFSAEGDYAVWNHGNFGSTIPNTGGGCGGFVKPNGGPPDYMLPLLVMGGMLGLLFRRYMSSLPCPGVKIPQE